MAWGPGKVGIEGEPIEIGGINVWNFEWIRCEQPSIEMPHPSHSHQKHKMNIYKVRLEDGEVTFAAGELSAGIYGFYEKVG